jgi:hypothetical protein
MSLVGQCTALRTERRHHRHRHALHRLATAHGARRSDLPDLAPFYAAFADLPLASVSHDQRRYLRHANWVGTVHHGLPRDLLAFQPNAGSYLAFLGRIAPEKGPNCAIEIAARSGMPLKIAAKGRSRRPSLLGGANPPDGREPRECGVHRLRRCQKLLL